MRNERYSPEVTVADRGILHPQYITSRAVEVPPYGDRAMGCGASLHAAVEDCLESLGQQDMGADAWDNPEDPDDETELEAYFEDAFECHGLDYEAWQESGDEWPDEVCDEAQHYAEVSFDYGDAIANLHEDFDEHVLPHVRETYEKDGQIDQVARCEAFNNWTDALCKDDEIDSWLYNNCPHPDSCERTGGNWR